MKKLLSLILMSSAWFTELPLNGMNKSPNISSAAHNTAMTTLMKHMLNVRITEALLFPPQKPTKKSNNSFRKRTGQKTVSVITQPDTSAQSLSMSKEELLAWVQGLQCLDVSTK